MPDPVDDLDFEDENAADGASALDHTRTLKIEYDPSNVAFWFTQLENEMYTCQVKSQWLKRCVLVKNLPSKVQADVMGLLTLKKSEAPDDLYKQIKTEILRLHAPKEEETFKKALSRVLVGLPSQLGAQLINDICEKSKKLTGCCCYKAVYTLWCLQLPLNVRGHVANMEFNGQTYTDVFKAADKVFLASKSADLSSAVAAVTVTPAKEDTPQVAAARFNNKKNKNKPPKKNSDGGQSGSGQSGGGSNRGRRHASNPPSSCCDNHYKWGKDAWFCLSPLSCPWKDKNSPRAEKEKN